MKSAIAFPSPGAATAVVAGNRSAFSPSVSAQPIAVTHNGTLIGVCRTLNLVDSDDAAFAVSIDAETGIATIEVNLV